VEFAGALRGLALRELQPVRQPEREQDAEQRAPPVQAEAERPERTPSVARLRPIRGR
jgi:hypothetical protein